MNLPRSRLQYRFLASALAAAMLFALIAGMLAYALGERRANAAAHQTIASMQAARTRSVESRTSRRSNRSAT